MSVSTKRMINKKKGQQNKTKKKLGNCRTPLDIPSKHNYMIEHV
jgi:hypothetical protein